MGRPHREGHRHPRQPRRGPHGHRLARVQPGGTTLAAGAGIGPVYLWEVTTRKVTAVLADPRVKGVASLAFSPGGTTLAASEGGRDGHVYLWDITARAISATITGAGDYHGPCPLAFAPDGKTLFTSGVTGGLLLWDITTGKVTASLPDPGGDTGIPGGSAAAFGPDGTLATTDMGGGIYLWDIATRKVTAAFTDPAAQGNPQVMAMVFGPRRHDPDHGRPRRRHLPVADHQVAACPVRRAGPHRQRSEPDTRSWGSPGRSRSR